MCLVRVVNFFSNRLNGLQDYIVKKIYLSTYTMFIKFLKKIILHIRFSY